MQKYRYQLLLLLASFFWGTTFVAQKEAMNYISPFAFNAIRFAIGGLILLPLVFYTRSQRSKAAISYQSVWLAGILAGLALFGGTSFQQVGMQTTTAGKAGFITGLYVVFVPLFSLALGKKYRKSIWAAAALSLIGMFLLSIDPTQKLYFHLGDILVFCSALCWAIHVLVIEKLMMKHEAVYIACCQFLTCALFSAIVSLGFETTTIAGVKGATIPILYAGILSAGVAFSIQVFVQKKVAGANVAIIMSFEAVFAAWAGWLILNETMNGRAIIGCILMFIGILLVQWRASLPAKTNKPEFRS